MNSKEKLIDTINISKLNQLSIINLLGFYSFIALISAYISQYFFHHQPCQLCIYQRIVFFVIIGAVIVANIFNFYQKKYNIQQKLFFGILLLLLVNSGIAFFHSGVEMKIFSLPASCNGGNAIKIEDSKELLKHIKNTNAIDCSKPSFYFLGLTMANWNFIYCLTLFTLSINLNKKLNRLRK